MWSKNFDFDERPKLLWWRMLWYFQETLIINNFKLTDEKNLFSAFTNMLCKYIFPNLWYYSWYQKHVFFQRDIKTNLLYWVQFQIIWEYNGTDAFFVANRNDIIDNLNDAFNDQRIYFNSIGTNYINDSNHVDIDNKNELDNLMIWSITEWIRNWGWCEICDRQWRKSTSIYLLFIPSW